VKQYTVTKAVTKYQSIAWNSRYQMIHTYTKLFSSFPSNGVSTSLPENYRIQIRYNTRRPHTSMATATHFLYPLLDLKPKAVEMAGIHCDIRTRGVARNKKNWHGSTKASEDERKVYGTLAMAVVLQTKLIHPILPWLGKEVMMHHHNCPETRIGTNYGGRCKPYLNRKRGTIGQNSYLLYPTTFDRRSESTRTRKKPRRYVSTMAKWTHH